MFSATFKKKIEKLARDVLSDPIRIVQGEGVGEANQDITQVVHVFKHGTSMKWDWLIENLVQFTSSGSVLIFVTKKANAQELFQNLESKTNFKPLLMHGDMNQFDRNKVITAFKHQESNVLIATDVAARGLDIGHIRTVINYDMALDIDTHTHRIGRTGRAGEKGVAYTLVTEKDKEMVGHLVRNLESANQTVSDELINLALQSQWFRKSRFKEGGKAKFGFGFNGNKRARPGLGFPKSEESSNNSQFVSSTSSSPSSSKIISQSKGSSKQTSESNRLEIMRAAYRAQFRSQFQAATNSSNNEQNEPKNKKSRWE